MNDRPERSVLHLLPHPGGGAETYLELLADMPGWRHERAVLSSSRNPLLAALFVAARMPALVRSAGRFDLVHVHGDAAALLSLPLLARRRAVVTTHGLHLLRRVRGTPLRTVARGLRLVAARCARVICTSHAERDELERIVDPAHRSRLVVVPNGIDLPPAASSDERRAIRAELGIRPEEVAALYLGQLEERKDPLTAVVAAERAAGAGAPLRLLVAGDGPLRDSVRAAGGPASAVLGFRADPDRLLAAADLFLLTSRREGSSFALLEAMGHGLPVVVSDGAGNAEIAGDAGIVYPFGEAEPLALLLGRLARDADERARLGAAARARVAGEFSRARMVDGVRGAYERAVTEPGRGSAAGAA